MKGTGKEQELKRKTNNHRPKHKDSGSHESYRPRKDKSLIEKKTEKYGVSTLFEDDSANSVEEEE